MGKENGTDVLLDLCGQFCLFDTLKTRLMGSKVVERAHFGYASRTSNSWMRRSEGTCLDKSAAVGGGLAQHEQKHSGKILYSISMDFWIRVGILRSEQAVHDRGRSGAARYWVGELDRESS